MGPLFVLLAWGVAAAFVSILVGGILVAVVSWATRREQRGRKRALLVAAGLPFALATYAFGCLLAFAVWSTARGYDMGFGDTWDAPLTGGYHLVMIDTLGDATLLLPGSKESPLDRVVASNIHRLQVHAPYILGAAGATADTTIEPASKPESVFFVFNAQTGVRTEASSLAGLQDAARALSIPFELKTAEQVYGDFRYTRADLLPGILFAIPPVVALWWLLKLLLRMRAQGEA